MIRYRTRSCIVANPQGRQPPSVFDLNAPNDCREVFEAPAWRDTGLLGPDGQVIWASDKGPLGFGRGGC